MEAAALFQKKKMGKGCYFFRLSIMLEVLVPNT